MPIDLGALAEILLFNLEALGTDSGSLGRTGRLAQARR